jgi:hypothetical protein
MTDSAGERKWESKRHIRYARLWFMSRRTTEPSSPSSYWAQPEASHNRGLLREFREPSNTPAERAITLACINCEISGLRPTNPSSCRLKFSPQTLLTSRTIERKSLLESFGQY